MRMLILFILLGPICACVHNKVREPASLKTIKSPVNESEYYSAIGANGIVFSIDPAVFKSGPSIESGDCVNFSPLNWEEKMDGYLKALMSDSTAFGKFNIFEMARGDKKSVELIKDSSGLVILSVHYIKKHRFSKAGTEIALRDLKCEGKAHADNIIETEFHWPEVSDLLEQVNGADAINSKKQEGLPATWVAQLAEQKMLVLLPKANIAHLPQILPDLQMGFSYWEKEWGIQGGNFKNIKNWFTIMKDKVRAPIKFQFVQFQSGVKINYGIDVQLMSRPFEKRLSHLKDSAFIYLQYIEGAGEGTKENSEKKFPSLSQLDYCLEKLSASDYEDLFKPGQLSRKLDSGGFLNPGFHCNP